MTDRRIVPKKGRFYPWQKKKSGYQIQSHGRKSIKGNKGWMDVVGAWFTTKGEAEKGKRELARQEKHGHTRPKKRRTRKKK